VDDNAWNNVRSLEELRGHPNPPLFRTLDDLIEPETLASLLHIPMKQWIMRREPITIGYSGATLERVTLSEAYKQTDTLTFVLKQIDLSTNWLMRATSDTTCRELQFTQSAFWKLLPAEIWSPILACAYGDDGVGILLMLDVQQWIFSSSICYNSPNLSLVSFIIDRLAAMHAACWGNSALHSASWLTTPADVMLMLTPGHLSKLGNIVPGYFKEAIEMWSYLWSLIDPADVVTIKRTLDDPSNLVRAINTGPVTLIHGDAWPANFGKRDEKLILLDWAFVSVGPPTFDSLWLANTWRTVDPNQILIDHRNALIRHGVTSVSDNTIWDLLVDLGWIRAVFMGVESLVRDVIDLESTISHTEAINRLRFWCHRTALILDRRRW